MTDKLGDAIHQVKRILGYILPPVLLTVSVGSLTSQWGFGVLLGTLFGLGWVVLFGVADEAREIQRRANHD